MHMLFVSNLSWDFSICCLGRSGPLLAKGGLQLLALSIWYDTMFSITHPQAVYHKPINDFNDISALFPGSSRWCKEAHKSFASFGSCSEGQQVNSSIFNQKDDANRNNVVGFPGADCNLYCWLIDKSGKSLFRDFCSIKMSPLLKYQLKALVQSLFFLQAAICSVVIVKILTLNTVISPTMFKNHFPNTKLNFFPAFCNNEISYLGVLIKLSNGL